MRTVRRGQTLACAIGACLSTACAHGRSARSYLPVGADAQYGANTNDGVTWTVARPIEQTVTSFIAVLQAEGFVVHEPSTASELRTSSRVVGGDTTVVVRTQFLAVALPEPGTSIVVTATYGVPSRKIRDAPVIQRANTTNSLYAYLVAIAAKAR